MSMRRPVPLLASIAAGSVLTYNKLPSMRHAMMMAPVEAAEATAESSSLGDPSTEALAFSLSRSWHAVATAKC